MIDILKVLQNYAIDTTTGCWEFNQPSANRTYAKMVIEGETYYVHRVVADLFIEPMNHHKMIHHTCCNKSCINPEHLMVLYYSDSHSKIHSDSKKNGIKQD